MGAADSYHRRTVVLEESQSPPTHIFPKPPGEVSLKDKVTKYLAHITNIHKMGQVHFHISLHRGILTVPSPATLSALGSAAIPLLLPGSWEGTSCLLTNTAVSYGEQLRLSSLLPMPAAPVAFLPVLPSSRAYALASKCAAGHTCPATHSCCRPGPTHREPPALLPSLSRFGKPAPLVWCLFRGSVGMALREAREATETGMEDNQGGR